MQTNDQTCHNTKRCKGTNEVKINIPRQMYSTIEFTNIIPCILCTSNE